MLHDNKDKKVSFRLSSSDYQYLLDYCNKYGLTFSKLIHILIKNHIIKEKQHDKES